MLFNELTKHILQKTFHVFNAEGKKTDVLLTIDDYDRLLEDLHDLAVLVERREETSISMGEMKKRLNYYE